MKILKTIITILNKVDLFFNRTNAFKYLVYLQITIIILFTFSLYYEFINSSLLTILDFSLILFLLWISLLLHFLNLLNYLLKLIYNKTNL